MIRPGTFLVYLLFRPCLGRTPGRPAAPSLAVESGKDPKCIGTIVRPFVIVTAHNRGVFGDIWSLRDFRKLCVSALLFVCDVLAGVVILVVNGTVRMIM